EEKMQYDKQYRLNNKDRLKQQGLIYYRSNKEYINHRMRLYYASHKEAHHERQRNYNQTVHGRMIRRASHQKRKALKRGANGTYTAYQLQQQKFRQKNKCYYCKIKLGKEFHADHIVPLSRGGSNDISNIVIACPTCNLSKKDKLPHEW